jgi:serine/threonine protein kinase
MTPERWQRIREVFHSACGQPPTQAEAFVRAQCGQDAEVCSEVLRMLGEHARGGMLDRSPWEATAATATEPALDQPVFPPGQLVSGRYRIVRLLGRGGMGEVYQAEDLELKELVAVKTLLPAIASDGRMLARFKQEIQLSRKVSHPNVCRIFDLARHPADASAPATTVFLTMEFLPGETLSARLHREGRLSAEAALPILSQTAEALDAAHRAGVIHRDFKPSNVMLVPTAGGTRAVVTDFGLARSCAPSGETTATLTGTLMGTLDYMAPELLAGEAPTVASDVYAFGTVAYKMVTGVLPFADAPLARSKGSAPSPKTLAPDLDEKWEQAILRTLDPDPDRRFARPGHFIKALQGEMPSVTLALPKVTRRRLVAALAAVILLVGGGVGWWQWRRSINDLSPDGRFWYQTGTAALRDGTYFRAANALERCVSINPGSALAHARLAESWNELDDSERAKEEMLRALAGQSSHPPARKADALYVDAIHRTLVGDYPGAITAYTELAGKVAATEVPQVLVDLGRAHERNDEVAKALEDYRKAARQDPQNAAAHLRTAILLGRQQKYDAATAEFDQADSLYLALSNTEGQAEVLFQRGLLASALRKLPEARAAVEKAIQLARAVSTEHQEIAATLQLGVVTYLEGNAARAEQIASETVDRARRSGLANLAARGLTDLGIARTGRGDYAGGEGSYREAIDLARRFRLHRNQARTQLQLSDALQRQGNAQAALKEVEPALAYYHQAGFLLETSFALTVLARAHRDVGNYGEARTEFEQLLAIATAADDRRQMMTAEQGVASVLFLVDRWPEALGHYEHHHELASQLRIRASIGLGLLNQAKVLWRLGRYSDAEKALAEARTMSAQPGSDILLPSLIAGLGAEMALSRNLFPEAAALAQKVLQMESATKPLQATAGCVAGLAKARAGSVQEGKRLCEEGVATASGLGDQAELVDNRLALAEILVAGGQAKAAEEQARLALERLRPAGRKESVWRCWSILARAYRRDGDLVHAGEAAGQAAAGLAELRSLWGTADFERYRRRRDIQGYLKESLR